jgi:hypothetical protein
VVGEGRHPSGERRDIYRWSVRWRHDRGGGEQTQGPDRAPMRVYATGDSEHCLFATPTDGGQILA